MVERLGSLLAFDIWHLALASNSKFSGSHWSPNSLGGAM